LTHGADIKTVAYNHVTAILQQCQKAKNVSFFFFLFVRSDFLFPRHFSGTIADTDKFNTPLESLRPADVHFGGYTTETNNLGGIFCCKIDYWL